jgi:hypothetical protein
LDPSPYAREDRLVGRGTLTSGLGVGGWVLFGTIEFRATGSGPIEFQVLPGALPFSRFNAGNVAATDVDFDFLALNAPVDTDSDGVPDNIENGDDKINRFHSARKFSRSSFPLVTGASDYPPAKAPRTPSVGQRPVIPSA